MEEGAAGMTHYYKPGQPGERKLFSFTIHGYTFEFISYTSLFSGSSLDDGTRLLLENIMVPRSGVVLDIGCGYGVIGIVVAKLNPLLEVYMTDVNPLAVKVARLNASRNNVEDRVVVLQGDRYKPVEGMKFNAIYSNPPLSAGMRIVEDIVLGARRYLTEDGFAQFVLARGGEYLAEKARESYSIVDAKSKKGYILLYLKP
ncbi:Ribosomal RNA small subunit methyltransferase C (RRNA (Guanine-n2-)- methyltransferase) [Desulfurococcus amylolyticus 1221n]|uniref:Ribosomal RNA small subunit methyltransferase C (RRNA (Guanine-n2-)-methyltransferase) n=2 Tax=Desulfurococcaceae TaxID=2272 RepID=B8D5U1_DESA1|nr:Ribosomal RNA small subunit methyltransferase C (RRNA (Guanine-n2-)- methyltransferase) [Desulfurococcus amylolyticus 1221n]